MGFALGVLSTASQGSIGLALLKVIQFNERFSMLVTPWTGLESSFGAIAQLKSFLAETKSEDSGAAERLTK